MSINLSVPEMHIEQELKPRITVVGVGGAGGNAVNDMISSQLEGVEFLVANTDAQALQGSNAERRVQMGASITHGLGAGAKPDVGRAAAEESLSELLEHLDGSNMAFVAAGMGGGTGTGAAPVIARAAREKGILTVGVVTKPFHFEGVHRMRLAEQGIEELEQYVDTLIVIPNQNLFRIANEKTTFADAFRMADEVLYSGVRGVTDLMVMPGMINLDFADIRSVMSEMGKAMMGTGQAEGERRALDAAEAAIANPLLDDCSMKGAKGVLINITGGSDMTLFEVDEAANRIRSEVDEDAYIIFGSAFDNDLDGQVRVSVVATGIDAEASKRAAPAILSAMERPASQTIQTAEADDPVEVLRLPDEPEVAQAPLMADSEPLVPYGHVEVEDDHTTDEAVGVAELGNPELPIDVPAEEVEADAATQAEPMTLAEEIKALSPAVADVMPEPAPVVIPEVEIAPAAMPGMDGKDAFIPPAPAMAAGKEEIAPAKPYAAAAMVNGASEPSGVVSTLPTRDSVKKRAGSLFGRIMGANKTIETPQPLDWQSNPPAERESASITQQPTLHASPAPMQSTMPSMPQSSPSMAVAQSQLSAMEEAERAPAADAQEDLLDIPAFLRRQAN